MSGFQLMALGALGFSRTVIMAFTPCLGISIFVLILLVTSAHGV